MKADFIALDLELEQPSNEIIQIGIAWVCRDCEDNTIHKKNFYVTPSGSVSPFIQDLTGIKDEHFDWTRSRREIYKEFCDIS